MAAATLPYDMANKTGLPGKDTVAAGYDVIEATVAVHTLKEAQFVAALEFHGSSPCLTRRLYAHSRKK